MMRNRSGTPPAQSIDPTGVAEGVRGPKPIDVEIVLEVRLSGIELTRDDDPHEGS
jgi:hypothetical protein